MTLPASPPDGEFIAFQQAVAGRYSLERELGRGGMGIVYLAREVRLARQVAIKVLPRASAASRPDLRVRFLREAQMAAQLSHPNIVPIHHVDEAGEFVFFVMTYIDGETLGERLRARGPLTPADAAHVLRDVAWALAYAHLRGIVHRDVKPDNILLERDTGRALVTDFGIAGDVLTPSAADGGYIRGTMHYLSPEQAAGAAADGRSDLYSLGVTGYYALTGQLPFEAPNAAAIMLAHATRRPAPIASVANHVPRRLAAAVERCIEKQPELRWPSGERFAEAVDAAFETPRELPAPLRAWLSQGNRERGIATVLAVYGGGTAAALATSGEMIIAGAIAGLTAALMATPAVMRLRRLIASGYGLADLQQAVEVNVTRRREELEYEAGSSLALTPRRLVLFGATAAAAAVAAATVMALSAPEFARTKWGMALSALTAVTTALSAISGIAALVRLGQIGRLGRLGAPRLLFWKSELGARAFKLAGLGMKRRTAAPSLPQHTEVALGRALDALYEALPRATRREVRDVPDTVRRLEGDARRLRDAIAALDDAAAAAHRVGQGHEASALERQRDAAANQLATVVTALETIRLGLLRLQIGSAPVAEVTQAIEAAAQVERELDIAAQAQREAGAAARDRR